MKEENQTEEAAATVRNPFYLQTNVFSDTINRYHQFRVARTTDYTRGINQIDIADGLKDSLIEHGFNLETVLDTKPGKDCRDIMYRFVCCKANTYCCNETISIKNIRISFSSVLKDNDG
jgi:hypothetical protein